MKKLMFAAALAATLGAFAIESANTVGYHTFTCQPNTWYLFGAQFKTTAGTSMTIQQFLQGAYAATDENLTAPEIQMWTGNDYVHYYFRDLAYDEDLNEYENVWANGVGDYTELAINPGDGVWFKYKGESAITVTVAGQVLETSTETVAVPANQWKCLSNPYPEALALNGNKANWSSILTATDENLTAPEIQIWSGNDYVHYYFRDLAYDEDLNEYENVWADAVGDYATYAIPSGEGFWIKNKVASPVDLVITK